MNKMIPLHIENIGATNILNSLKQKSCFPNAIITYQIVLTIPINVASDERNISKLKLLKSYLWSSMLQEKPNRLASIAIGHETLEEVNIESLVDILHLNMLKECHFSSEILNVKLFIDYSIF